MLPKNLSVSLGIHRRSRWEDVNARVRPQLAISTGAACSSGIETPSHVLQALKLPSDVIEGALRLGIGKFTTSEEIDQTADILSATVRQVQQAICLQV